MIVTDTTLTGYTVINGSWGLQFGLLVGSTYNYLVYPSSELVAYPNSTNNIPKFAEVIRIALIFLHALLMMVNILMQADRLNAPTLKYIMAFTGMMLYVYAIIQVAWVNYETPTPDNSANLATGAIVTWFRIELACWFGIVVSNIIFMLLRGLFKHKIDHSTYMDESKKLPNIDTMIALHAAGTSFHTEFVPTFVSTVLYFSKSGHQVTSSHILTLSLRCVLVSSYISTFIVTILIFCHWKKGPVIWKRYAPYGFYFLIMLVYIILPLINIFYQVYEMASP